MKSLDRVLDWLEKAKKMLPAVHKPAHPSEWGKPPRSQKPIPSMSESDHHHAFHAALHTAKVEARHWSSEGDTAPGVQSSAKRKMLNHHEKLANQHLSKIKDKKNGKNLHAHYYGHHDMETHHIEYRGSRGALKAPGHFVPYKGKPGGQARGRLHSEHDNAQHVTPSPSPKMKKSWSDNRMDLIKAAQECSGALMESYMGFKKLKSKLAGKKGIKDAGAVAASIGRKKFGNKKFQIASAKGKKMRSMKPKG